MVFGGVETEECASKNEIRSTSIRLRLFLTFFIGVPLIYGASVL
jgi:hypothetical protein